MIEISAYPWVPPFAQGYVKDLRVRWALEEAGLPYQTVLIDVDTKNSAQYRCWQPFGQVPAYRDGEVELFESGAIVMHIAAKSAILAPADAAGRARVAAWVVAALNSVEPHAQAILQLEAGCQDEAWAGAHRGQLQDRLNSRLAGLTGWLGDKPHLETDFTAADLMMSMVLRELNDDGLLADFPSLQAYCRRCLGRPAFDRALQAQLRVFRENAPG